MPYLITALGVFFSTLALALPAPSDVFTCRNDGFSAVRTSLEEQYRLWSQQDDRQFDVFVKRGEDTLTMSASDFKKTMQAGDLAFVPTQWVRPLQTVISYYGVGVNVFLKAEKLDFPRLKYHNQQATHDLSSAKAAVIGPHGAIYLLDGHHTFTASILAGAQSFPIRIAGSYASLSEQEFIETLLKEERAYLLDLESGRQASRLKKSFAELDDSSLRGWIDAAGAEIPETSDTVRVVRAEISTPAWIRDANQMPPFAEFKIARILLDEGLSRETCPECFKAAPSLAAAGHANETIRHYMIKAADHGRLRDIPGVYVLRNREDLRSLRIEDIVTTPTGISYRVHVYTVPFGRS